MKKWIGFFAFCFGLVGLTIRAEATHRTAMNANNLISGTVPDARLNPSSVTLQGNHTLFSTITAAIAALESSTNSAEDSIAELRITTPIFKTRLDNLDSSTASLTTRAIGLEASTATLEIRANNLNTSTGNLTTAISTTGLRVNGLSVSTDSLRSNLSNIVSSNIVNGTITGDDVASTASIVVTSLTVRGSITSTDTIAGKEFRFPDGTTQNTLAITSAASSVNAFHLAPTTVTAGQYTNANISIDADGRVVQAANGTVGGGGGSGSRALALTISPAVGMGADFVGTDQTPFDQAISSLTPGGGIIVVRGSGTYSITSQVSVIPWNVTLLCEPGSLITNSGNIMVFVNSGTVDGCTFIPAGEITGQFMTLNDSSTVKNVVVKNAVMGSGGAVFKASSMRNIFFDRVQAYNNVDSDAWSLGKFTNSSDIIIQRGYNNGNATATDYLYDIQGSTRVIFKDTIHIDRVGDAMIGLVGGVNHQIMITGCIIKSEATTGIGLIYGSARSSGVIITNNYMQGNNNGSSRAINPQDQTSASNWTISGNVFEGFFSASIFLPSAASNWYLHGNRTLTGVFVSDSGANTLLRDNVINTHTFNADAP